MVLPSVLARWQENLNFISGLVNLKVSFDTAGRYNNIVSVYKKKTSEWQQTVTGAVKHNVLILNIMNMTNTVHIQR